MHAGRAGVRAHKLLQLGPHLAILLLPGGRAMIEGDIIIIKLIRQSDMTDPRHNACFHHNARLMLWSTMVAYFVLSPNPNHLR